MTSTTYSRDGRFLYEDQFRPDLTPAEHQAVIDEIANDLAQLGFEATITTDGETFRVSFTNEADMHVFADELSRAQPQYDTAEHVHAFNGVSPEYERHWMQTADWLLRDSGMEFQAEHQPGRAVFTFPSYLSRVMFSKLVETGFIDKRCRLHSEHPVPDEPPHNKPEEPGY